MIGTFKDGQLKRFWQTGRMKGISPTDAEHIAELLTAIDAATAPGDLALLGIGFHPLKGDRKDQFAVTIRANWRIVFEWQNGQAVRVRQEDYHGK